MTVPRLQEKCNFSRPWQCSARPGTPLVRAGHVTVQRPEHPLNRFPCSQRASTPPWKAALRKRRLRGRENVAQPSKAELGGHACGGRSRTSLRRHGCGTDSRSRTLPIPTRTVSHGGRDLCERFCSGPELDLLIFHGGKRYGVELKYSETPNVSRPLRSVVSQLDLERLWVVVPGDTSYPIDQRITVCGLSTFPEEWLRGRA